jgi:hypothetical protein
MQEHARKALKLNYEQFHEYLKELVELRLAEKKRSPIESAEEVVSDVFSELRATPDKLSRFLKSTNEFFEVPFESDAELESHIVDSVVEEIRDNELYASKKTGTPPDLNRL